MDAVKPKATKKSAASDPLTKLKERLVRGERLTEDELVQLELAAVSRYDQLQKEGENRRESLAATVPTISCRSSSCNAAASSSTCKKPPAAAAASAAASTPAKQQQRDGIKELTSQADEMRELRELRQAAERERAQMDETANELARLRQLRLEVTHNPQAALNITTGRELNADENKFQYAMPMAAYSPGPSHNPAATIAQVSGIQGQLRSHLAKNHGKVLDLFRTWDVDGDGTVRKVEMRRAVASLGFEAPPSAVDALFDSFDRDHGGGIEYKELCRVLRREAETESRLRADAYAAGPAPPPPPSSGGVFGWLTGGRSSTPPPQQQPAPPPPQPQRKQPPPPVQPPPPEPPDVESGWIAEEEGGEDREEEAEEGAGMDDLAAAIYGDQSSRGEEGAKATDAAQAANGAGVLPSAARSCVSVTSEVTTAKGGAPPSVASSSAAAAAKPKPAAKSKPVKLDPTALRDGALWELVALVETAAPWAAWQAAESLAVVPNLGARPSDAPPSAASAAPKRKPQLPPVRSVLADVLSLVALLMAAASVYMQMAALSGGLGGAALRMRRRLWGGDDDDDDDDDDAGDESAAMPTAATTDVTSSLVPLLPLHAFACVAWLVLLLLLLRQLYARVAPAPASSKAPLLPTATPAATSSAASAALAVTSGAAPFAHWSTLSLGETFLAAYMMCWALPLAPPASAAAALVLARQLAAGSAAFLLCAASWRALLMLLWHCRCLPGAGALPSPPAEAAKPPAKAAAAKPAVPAKPPLHAAALASCTKLCTKLVDGAKQLLKRCKGGASTKGGAKGGAKRPGAATPARSAPPKKGGKKSMV